MHVYEILIIHKKLEHYPIWEHLVNFLQNQKKLLINIGLPYLL